MGRQLAGFGFQRTKLGEDLEALSLKAVRSIAPDTDAIMHAAEHLPDNVVIVSGVAGLTRDGLVEVARELQRQGAELASLGMFFSNNAWGLRRMSPNSPLLTTLFEQFTSGLAQVSVSYESSSVSLAKYKAFFDTVAAQHRESEDTREHAQLPEKVANWLGLISDASLDLHVLHWVPAELKRWRGDPYGKPLERGAVP